ncbi:MAG: 4Fe-4S binding protein [Anaerolineae bacterium]
MQRGIVLVDRDRCKGCELCVRLCPHHLLAISTRSLNRHGYHPVEFHDPEARCTGCSLCAWTCPDVALAVYRWQDARRAVAA